jgi:hypothetical protein
VKRIVGRELQGFPKPKILLRGTFKGWCATTGSCHIADACAGVTLPLDDAHFNLLPLIIKKRMRSP